MTYLHVKHSDSQDDSQQAQMREMLCHLYSSGNRKSDNHKQQQQQQQQNNASIMCPLKSGHIFIF